jgi:electron transfer flavoprotein beta subunit
MMNMIVCLKQALDVTQLEVDQKTRKPLTADAPKKISDFDKNALQEAIEIKGKQNAEITTITLGSHETKTNLKEALAMGADQAYLLTDPSFENSDTLATSKILSKAIQKLGHFDLILCGEASIDSFTGQVGPQIAEQLHIPAITHAQKLTINSNTAIAERKLKDRHETVKTEIPVLVTVSKGINEPRIPSLMDIMKASKKPLVTWDADDLQIPKEEVGKAGSHVEVVDVLAPKTERKKTVIKGETPQEIAEKLAKALIQEGVVGR